MNKGYFINPTVTPLDQIDFNALKAKGITEVYIEMSNKNYNKYQQHLVRLNKAGLKPFAWVWPGFTKGKEVTSLGWNVCIDAENYTMKKYVPELTKLREDTQSKTLIICTKPTFWDGDQKWELLAPICDYIMPMLYLGDYNKTTAQLVTYMKAVNMLYPGKIYPALETYVSDKHPTPKPVVALNNEIEVCKPYCPGVGLFRYGLSKL